MEDWAHAAEQSHPPRPCSPVGARDDDVRPRARRSSAGRGPRTRPCEHSIELAAEIPGASVDFLKRAYLLAMLGRFDEARSLAASRRRASVESWEPTDSSVWFADIAALAGDYEAAVRYEQKAVDGFEEHGHLDVPGELRSRSSAVGCAPSAATTRPNRWPGSAGSWRVSGSGRWCLASGASARARPPRRARGGGARSRARRSRSPNERTSSATRATRSVTWARCSPPQAAPRRPRRRSSRRWSARDGRRTWRWSHRWNRSSRRCAKECRYERARPPGLEPPLRSGAEDRAPEQLARSDHA